MKKILILFLLCLFLAGCGAGTKQRFRIKLFDCDSKVIQEWESDGWPDIMNSDVSAYFTDRKTGLEVAVSGTFTIEEIK